jgi:nucleotide-binding universal stress UspA family protein
MTHTPYPLLERPRARPRTRAPLLVAVGPAGGTEAIRAAHALAARDASPLVVCSVVEPPPIYAFESNRALLLPWIVEQQISERREAVFDRLRELRLVPSPRGEPAVEVRYGSAADTIAAIARDLRASLIVVGAGPRAPRQRLLATGTALAVSRHAPAPVLAVAHDARPVAHVAVAATDFSPESIRAARAALPLLADGAVLYLVHAWTRTDTVFENARLTTLDDEYASSIPEAFYRFRTALGPHPDITIHTKLLEGPPAELVLGVARAQNADLIVAGTHGRGAVERWLIGSTSAALLRGAGCSVLLAPPPPPTERLRLVRHMRGSAAVHEPEQWDAELRSFVRRNLDRRTRLEIDDPGLGARVLESGLSLVGATYDARARKIELMFASPTRREAHFTRTLGRVRSVAVTAGARDDDRALFIESDGGGTFLTFLDPPRAPRSSADA